MGKHLKHRWILLVCAWSCLATAGANEPSPDSAVARWRSSLSACAIGPGSDLLFIRVFGGAWPIPTDFVLLSDSTPDLEWYAAGVAPTSPEAVQTRLSRIWILQRPSYEQYWAQTVRRSGAMFEKIGALSTTHGEVISGPEGPASRFAVVTDGSRYLLMTGPVADLHEDFLACFRSRERGAPLTPHPAPSP